MVEHHAPSTYILRNLQDVEVLAPVSWMPQTLGWKVLFSLVATVCVYLLINQIRRWWDQRYRREALMVLTRACAEQHKLEESTYQVLKLVMTYIQPTSASLFGAPFLQALEQMTDGQVRFDDKLGKLWMNSVVNPSVELSLQQRNELTLRAMQWLKQHKPAIAEVSHD
ncbi:DUF4381 domain-containing protein [Vibrio sp. SCSIO 43136]|uniref:DUF4381 domain-containing protein n=1 Tax=Vibrio sp. SCSIO 43136 TaxID=2819101 RepID=UPI002075A200|nr:DUF4381 domain-containing protein [Vibrio sp. SCSIO 43136]USD64272.1 DUF4381 domain-containing protein [Vibrio sp. SCSIO 43136]